MIEVESSNFIEDIINEDLKSGKHKEIITRFPPEPNGYLHIGHAKALCVNFGIKEKYKGKCNLRYDDTNPSKEDVEYVDSIEKDIKWLGFEWDNIFFASDYFERMYDCAVNLIKKGLAYVCDLSAEQIKENRGSLKEPGNESPYRNRTVEENLNLFERMRKGEFADGEKVLRAKIDMSSSNLNMRDPVIYRILRARHHRTANKWVIYPMYDFAHPLEDAFENITHSCCTLEFEDHRPLYDWVKINCGFDPGPRQIEFARLNIRDAVMSKRYLKKLVDDKIVDGWDDPRMPTLAGMRERGYTPNSIKKFCQMIGVAKANSTIGSDYLEFFVREDLDSSSKRVMVVKEPLDVEIVNMEEDEICLVSNNAFIGDESKREVSISKNIYIEKEDFMLNPPKGYKRLCEGAKVRLYGSYIVEYLSCDLDENGDVKKVYVKYLENTKTGQEFAKTKVNGTIHFVNQKDCIDCILHLYSPLFKEEVDGIEMTLDERLNKDSHKVLKAKAEKSLINAKAYERYQFMRDGYYMARASFKEGLPEFNKVVGLKVAAKNK